MKLLNGKGVSKGIAFGNILFLENKKREINDTTTDIEAEKEKYINAKATAQKDLRLLIEKATDSDTASLLDVHCELLDDPDFEDYIISSIEQGHSVDYAVIDAGDYFSSLFAEMNDSYMCERSRDILDISERLSNILNKQTEIDIPDGEYIIVCDDIAPSVCASLDSNKIKGLILGNGAENGHTAILCKTSGIPLIIGVKPDKEFTGCSAILDSVNGDIIISPDDETINEYKNKKAEFEKNKAELSSLIGLESITKEGQKIDIYCNIATPTDVDAVIANDASGIGVFRSEFLYIGRKTLPTEDEQYRDYKAVVEKMNGKEVVIRTLDIGSDKQAECLPLPKEENPAMGERAIRICLDNTSLFKTQLRAIYRASAYGNVSIMFPMIASRWEIIKAKEICEEVKAELKKEKIPYSENMKIGIMIEIPSAALCSDELAKEVDFFSIGTNDLSQYTLAIDRTNDNIDRYFDKYHPAILKLISITAENAHKAGIPVAICGETAKDTELLPFYLKCKINELSVTADAVLPLKKAIREL